MDQEMKSPVWVGGVDGVDGVGEPTSPDSVSFVHVLYGLTEKHPMRAHIIIFISQVVFGYSIGKLASLCVVQISFDLFAFSSIRAGWHNLWDFRAA